jgi:hypothetical protein
MSTTALPDSSLLRAVEGLRNRRAILIIAVGWLVSTLVSVLGAGTGSVKAGMIISFIGMLLFLYAICAAGIVLLEVARGGDPPGIFQACAEAIPAFLRLLGVVVLGLIALLIYWIVVAALFFVCKLPGIGPALYMIVLPVIVVFTAMMLAIVYVCVGLLGPAVWDGHTLGGAISRMQEIAKGRWMEALMQFVLLLFLAMLVSLIIYVLIATALFATGMVSLRILDVSTDSDWAALLSIFSVPGSVFDNYFSAGFVGVGLAFLLLGAAIFSMQIMGANLIYLRMSGDAAGAVNTGRGPLCPACGLPREPADKFCGECGAK